MKSSEGKSNSSKLPQTVKFKDDLCSSGFKKEIILKKHKNSKHDHTYCPHEKKIGEGTFSFTFDIIPGKGAEPKAMRLEWSKKEENNLTEKEPHIMNDKSEKGEFSVNDGKSKGSDFWDIKDYFQIELVEGETVFLCNICNEGLNNEQEITKHMTQFQIEGGGV